MTPLAISVDEQVRPARSGANIHPIRVSIPAIDKVTIYALTSIAAISILTAWTAARWITPALEFAAFAMAFVSLVRIIRSAIPFRFRALLCVAAAFPAVGCLQLAIGHPAYRFATIEAALYWAALASLLFTGIWMFSSGRAREIFLIALLWLGAVATVLEIVQIFGYDRHELTSTGYPLLSSNYYAELIELIFPIALVCALRRHRLWWMDAGLAALFAATVIASGARMGTILVLVEALTIFNLARRRSFTSITKLRNLVLVFIVLIAGWVVIEGPGTLLQRLHETDPLQGRSDIGRSALAMVRSRPWTGYGLGNFPVVYPAFATFDNGYFINHVHNDWLEAAVDGGIPFLGIMFIFCVTSVPAAWRSAWGVGSIAVILHAWVDFPFQRFGVAAVYVLIVSAAITRNR